MAKKIKIQLIPKTCSGQNVRNKYTKAWKHMSRMIRINAGEKCEICGSSVPRYTDLEAHEVWAFKKEEKDGKIIRTQELKDVIAVCSKCHAAIHLGHSLHNDLYDEAVTHYMAVNDCKFSDVRQAEKKAYLKWKKRSKHDWKMTTTKKQAWKIVKKHCNA